MFLIVLFSLFAYSAHSDTLCNPTVRIGVLDTGFGYQDKGHSVKLCKFGHKDFSGDNVFLSNYGTVDPIPSDNGGSRTSGHGTNIAGLIDMYASHGNDNYCLVIIKYFSSDPAKNQGNSVNASLKALQYAKLIGVDLINYSGGGVDKSEAEDKLIKEYLDAGGIFVAAAGNEKSDIDKKPFFPAMADPRILVVGNNNSNGTLNTSSNYGRSVRYWANGTNVSVFGITLTGTSQATAVVSGKISSMLNRRCDI